MTNRSDCHQNNNGSPPVWLRSWWPIFVALVLVGLAIGKADMRDDWQDKQISELKDYVVKLSDQGERLARIEEKLSNLVERIEKQSQWK